MKEIGTEALALYLQCIAKTTALLQTFEDRESAVAYLCRETGLPEEECARAADVYLSRAKAAGGKGTEADHGESGK
ncbi:MAG: hypothetical protein Q4C53_06020 [Clostridia bacterium]|nr:hypothetical protein [Clostridia bacterium]